MNNKKTILVVGGAGFIGSHMALSLYEAGHHVVVLDNLSKGYRESVLHGTLIEADMQDRAALDKVFTDYNIDAVMHFASFIEVGESVQKPAKYYQNNLAASLTLLEAMLAHNVKQFIFSSTAAVYGEPQYTPIDEKHPKAPINPYGRSKHMLEQILEDFAKSDGLQYTVLRYFNAAGADPLGRLGEWHEPETHLIPLILQVANGQREHIKVFGRDYATPDGSCLRDYIHVTDLCAAHLLALQHMQTTNENMSLNLGTGEAYSVLEVIKTVEQVTNRSIKVESSPRRAGDPAILLADPCLAMETLNWQPKYSDIRTIIQHAWTVLQQEKTTLTG